MDDVTVVVTSCGRHDLLELMLASFRKFNSYAGLADLIVIEDGAIGPVELCQRFGATLLVTGERVGQARAIDLAYARVTTPFIFHVEDDWEFYRSGFIENSRAVLSIDLSTVVVWLRAWSDTNDHPMSFMAPDDSFGVLSTGFATYWHGFTFNPGLRRLSDYQRLGSFSDHRIDEFPGPVGAKHEAGANKFYFEHGYRAVILERGGYVRHLGEGRHVPDHPHCTSVS